MNTEDQEWPGCNDEVLLLAYFPAVGPGDEYGSSAGARAYMRLGGGRRKAGQDVLELPLFLPGRSMELYIAVVSQNRKTMACSQYLGQIGI